MAVTRQQRERLEFLEEQVKELARQKQLIEILLAHSQPQLIVLEAESQPNSVSVDRQSSKPCTPPCPESLLAAHERKLIDDYPGMLFSCCVLRWQVGLTLEKNRLVFVPDVLYQPYEAQCLQAAGWSEQQEDEWDDRLEAEDEGTGKGSPTDWSNPTRRAGVWKARQVAHWTGETNTPELDYGVWANGMWG